MSNVSVHDGTIRIGEEANGPTPEARHRAAARAYDMQYRVLYSWAPVWDGAKFVIHAWAPDPMRMDFETRRITACGAEERFPSTFVVSGSEPRCEKCWDATLEPLARAFAKAEIERG